MSLENERHDTRRRRMIMPDTPSELNAGLKHVFKNMQRNYKKILFITHCYHTSKLGNQLPWVFIFPME